MVISIDFFGCERGQIVSCSWNDAIERFPSAGLSIPDERALTSLNETLTGSARYPVQPLHLSIEPIYELCADLVEEIRRSDAESMKEASVRWARLTPWDEFEVNPMDLAGFLLELRTLVDVHEKARNSIFLWMESNDIQSP